jgi:hypothetical protein
MSRTTVVAGLALLLAGASVSARAAGLAGETLDAHVPFAFEVRGTNMPAGRYVVREAQEVDPNLLEIRSADGQRAAFFFVEDSGTRSTTPVQPRLVFDRVGEERFLRSLRLADGDRERLPVSTDEIRLARRQAGPPATASASPAPGR